jgi:hypothetical protein
MRIFRAPAFLIVMVLSASSSAAEYSSIKQLLLAAIDASDGRASGFILGQIAEKFNENDRINGAHPGRGIHDQEFQTGRLQAPQRATYPKRGLRHQKAGLPTSGWITV